jgi:hypothetical protein
MAEMMADGVKAADMTFRNVAILEIRRREMVDGVNNGLLSEVSHFPPQMTSTTPTSEVELQTPTPCVLFRKK